MLAETFKQKATFSYVNFTTKNYVLTEKSRNFIPFPYMFYADI